jgi:hypothetical protein
MVSRHSGDFAEHEKFGDAIIEVIGVVQLVCLSETIGESYINENIGQPSFGIAQLEYYGTKRRRADLLT